MVKNPLKGDQISLPLVRSHTCKRCAAPTESPILDRYCPQCFEQLTKNVPLGMCAGWYDPNDLPVPFWHQPIFFDPQTMCPVNSADWKFPNSSPELGDFLESIDDPQELVSTSDSQKSPNCCDELGDFLPPLPGKYLSCRKINKSWVGSIEHKIIKGRSFYYWRHRVKGNFGVSKLASDYLGNTWGKALERVDRLQVKRLGE